ncbi:MAG TPA: hypothetical protein VFN79_17865, partial [Steroidobacteraceae bacterium]|nr:hypothetical protein [Steroidobacteraceae bacterium]
PWVGLLVTYVVGVVFFFPFPSWQKLVSAVSLITVLSYSIGPLILLHLRKALPDAPRPFRLRAAGIVAPIAFISSNWIIYWTGYAVTEWMFGAVFAYIVVYLAWYMVRRRPWRDLGLREAWWVAPYLAGMWVVSYLGPAGAMGGRGVIGFFTGMWILAGFSLLILWLALAAGQDAAAARQCAERVKTLASSGVESGREASQLEVAP